jgi:hypothetical protein
VTEYINASLLNEAARNHDIIISEIFRKRRIEEIYSQQNFIFDWDKNLARSSLEYITALGRQMRQEPQHIPLSEVERKGPDFWLELEPVVAPVVVVVVVVAAAAAAVKPFCSI